MIYIGDTHGNFQHQIYEFGTRKNVNYIHVGDFGMLFSDHKSLYTHRKYGAAIDIIKSLNVALVKANSKIWICRGNHDNPIFWEESEKWNLSNITFVPDYTVLEIEGKKVLFVGGAISVDRSQYMDEGVFWWKREIFNYDQDKIDAIINDNDRLDVVVTHTIATFIIPIGFPKFVQQFFQFDRTLESELKEERKKLSKLYQFLNTKFDIPLWVYGHFHTGSKMFMGPTVFRMIPENTYLKEEDL